MSGTNSITAIAKKYGRHYITPEDINEAIFEATPLEQIGGGSVCGWRLPSSM